MKLKGIVFDIGNTLVTYPFPLSWSSLYRPAFEHVAKKNNMNFSQEEYDHFIEVMSHYNSRLSPRDTEVTSEQIFSEILEGTSIPLEMKETVKRDFYGFFQSEAHVTPEAEGVLQELVSKGIKTATYSNVAYGMDNELALEDIAPVIQYIDLPYTSHDTFYRKPNPKGLLMIAEKMELKPEEIAFVGDEKKDIECAKGAGALAILINRSEDEKDFGQDLEIRDLSELLELIKD
ncbi:MAG: HAD family hydrolase [Erysipelotrichaceae bacterium]|nr:HAD family hydrolase [Erysipelotrichaceae bacterium]